MTIPEPPTSALPTATTPQTGGAVGTAPLPASPARRRFHATRRGAFLALLVFVTVVLVLFVVFNTQTVVVHLVFGEVHVPLVLALVVAAGLGALIVGSAVMLRAVSRRRSSNGS